MEQTSILEKLQSVLREHLQIEAVTTSATDLQIDLGLDSLQQLTFVVETENIFAICFNPEDEAGLKTLGDIAAYIQRQQNAGAPSSDALERA